MRISSLEEFNYLNSLIALVLSQHTIAGRDSEIAPTESLVL